MMTPTSGSGALAAATPGTSLRRIPVIVGTLLGLLLLGYMFLGRGFAHLGVGPLYVGDLVLIFCVGLSGYALLRGRARIELTPTVALLLVFMALGAVHTVPYLGADGFDALRDGTVWGYAAFTLVIVTLLDEAILLKGLRFYGWVVPVFALWLPISWNMFATASASLDPARPGSFVPLVFFKGGDMAVHTVGAVAFLVIAAAAWRAPWTFIVRAAVTLPLLWTAFVAGTSNRGALLVVVVGVVCVAVIGRRTRNWLPILVGAGVFVAAVVLQAVLASPGPSSAGVPAPLAQGPGAAPSGASSSVGRSPATSEQPLQAVTVAMAAAGVPTVDASPRPAGGGSSGGSPGASPGASAGAVALVNPGFEAVSPDGGIPGWTFFGVGRLTSDDQDARTGMRSARIDSTGTAYQAQLNGEPFDISSGPDIAVSAWAEAISGRPTIEIYVNWYDVSGAIASSQFVARIEPEVGTGWHLGEGYLKIPAGVVQAQVRFWEAAGAAVVAIDDVSVGLGTYIAPPAPPKGRPASIGQIVDNILSVFGSTTDSGLEGSKQFRLAWWGKIVDYTVFGDNFWTGKGFGVNLADVDGFQATSDHSLRSPHNTHLTILAREGVPGLVVWVLLQVAFAFGLIRAFRTARRAGNWRLAALGALVLVYWIAMMIDTSFDPYLEGPQGGIWFWCLFGVGIVVMRLARERRATA
jgi:hypothetical protein